MSDSSPNLDLPLIQAAQAQKHVTHNEALARLDVLAQLVVQELEATDPPEAPADGKAWIVGTGATDGWAGEDGQIAAWLNGGWVFVTPQVGWIAVEAGSGTLRIFGADGWRGLSLADVGRLGIGATPDDFNRLVVASPATLLTHAGSDHRLTVNKANAAATGSLLFQSDYSGRAEMGLAGEDAFSVKVSPDGSAWTTALRVDPTDGTVGGAAVQASPDDISPGRLMRADYGYGPGNVLGPVGFQGGFPSGAVIETAGDDVSRYTKFFDGTLICEGLFENTEMTLDVPSAGGFTGPTNIADFPHDFSTVPVVTVNLRSDTEAHLYNVRGSSQRAQHSLWSLDVVTLDVRARYVAYGRWD